MLEQFRRIAAEGRKFGLFLIMVSQRPDKLNPLVVSECENRAVMKLGSEAVLKITSDALGLGDVLFRQLTRCLEFDVGRAVLIGTWVADREGPVFLYGAARRTQEGGKSSIRNTGPIRWRPRRRRKPRQKRMQKPRLNRKRKPRQRQMRKPKKKPPK